MRWPSRRHSHGSEASERHALQAVYGLSIQSHLNRLDWPRQPSVERVHGTAAR